jgi:allophanate hydrolase
MRGQPHHANLDGATLVEDVHTAPAYRLYGIGSRYPAMVRFNSCGVSIAPELCDVQAEIWLRVCNAETPGLYWEPITLLDGRAEDAMLGEEDLVAGEATEDISRFGGWRGYLASR